MASDRSDSSGGRAGAPPDDPPRDHILPQATPREGWTTEWRLAIDDLCAFVAGGYPNANLHALRQRLAPLLTRTVELIVVGTIEERKPATVIRDAIVALRGMPPGEAIEALRRPEPVFRDYLDGRLEAEDADVDRPLDLDLASTERAARRYALIADRKNDVLPQPRRGAENPWATVADLVAELLADVTGKEPKRTYHHYGGRRGADAGWPLAFFKRFAALAAAPAKPPRLDKVWRNALDARRKIKAAIITARV